MPKLKAVVCPGVPEAERERLNGEGGCAGGAEAGRRRRRVRVVVRRVMTKN